MLNKFTFEMPPVPGETEAEAALRRIEEAGLNVRAIQNNREDTWIAIHELVNGDIGQRMMEEFLIDRIEGHRSIISHPQDCYICHAYADVEKAIAPEDGLTGQDLPEHIVGALGLSVMGAISLRTDLNIIDVYNRAIGTGKFFTIDADTDPDELAMEIVIAFADEVIRSHRMRLI